MKTNDAKNTVLLLGSSAVLTCTDGDLKIKWQIGLEAGRYECRQWLDIMDEGDELAVPEKALATFLQPALGRHQRMAFGDGSHQTGANPNFKPSKATDLELRMHRLTEGLTARADNLEKRQKRMERIAGERQVVIDAEAEALEAAELEAAREAQNLADLAASEAADAAAAELAATEDAASA